MRNGIKNDYILEFKKFIIFFRFIIIYNSLTVSRRQLTCVYVTANITDWLVRDSQGKVVQKVQINYVWDFEVLLDTLEICFMCNLKPLSLTQFTLEKNEGESIYYEYGKVELYNFGQKFTQENIVNLAEVPESITIENEETQLHFDGADGLLRKFNLFEKGVILKSHDMRIQFMTYGTKSGKKTPKSGAYIFLPDTEEAQDLNYGKPSIRVTKGPLISKLEVVIEKPILLRHEVSLIKGENFFHLDNELLLAQGDFGNKELVMRFYTDVNNEDIFYTDLNGFQVN